MKKINLITLITLFYLSTAHYCHGWFWQTTTTTNSSGESDSLDYVTDAQVMGTKEFAIANVTTIDISGSGSLFITIDPQEEETLSIVGDENIVNCIDVFNNKKRLLIKPKDNCSFSTTTPLEYHVTVKKLSALYSSGSINTHIDNATTLSSIDISGASSLTINNIETDLLDIVAEGSSHITVNNATVNDITIISRGAHQTMINNITAGTINAELKGSCNVQLSGKADTQKIHLSGASHYKASDLVSARANATLKGSSSAQVHVDNALSYTLSGASSLSYYGNAAAQGSKTGSASVKGPLTGFFL
jgi:hypothetical protein